MLFGRKVSFRYLQDCGFGSCLNLGIFGLKSGNFPDKTHIFEKFLWYSFNHYASNFNISRTFKEVSNILQNFTFMGTTVFEIAGGLADPPPSPYVNGVSTKRLRKGRVNLGYDKNFTTCSLVLTQIRIKIKLNCMLSYSETQNIPVIIPLLTNNSKM